MQIFSQLIMCVGHYKLFIQTTEECNAWGYNDENGEKYPPDFDCDCSDKIAGFLHISDNKGNNTYIVKNIICQSTPVTKCTLYLASKNKWMWWWVGGVTATTRMQINLILKDISGRGCRAHADHHSWHHHQQYWQSLLSQYIQVCRQR